MIAKEAVWLDVRGAAEALGLGRGTVYQLAASGALACYRIGPNRGRIRFKAEDIAAYVEASRVGPKPVATPAPARRRYVPEFDTARPKRR